MQIILLGVFGQSFNDLYEIIEPKPYTWSTFNRWYDHACLHQGETDINKKIDWNLPLVKAALNVSVDVAYAVEIADKIIFDVTYVRFPISIKTSDGYDFITGYELHYVMNRAFEKTEFYANGNLIDKQKFYKSYNKQKHELDIDNSTESVRPIISSDAFSIYN